ncbi:MAG: transposase [Defluviitaleaceae bacterium]|nr:transposase [Defluviitaleaceae bacterium]
MILAHKIQLDPTNKQSTYFAKACGVARFAYNWALDRWKKQYEAGEKVTEAKLRKELNAIKRTEYPWMMEVTKCSPQLAIMDLGKAYQNFFAKRAEFPKFKKKGQKDSFGISNDQFSIKEKTIRIPNLGYVRMTEKLRFNGKIMGAVISRRADRWFVSVQVEIPESIPIHNSESQAVGVDLGVKELATLSDGTKISGAKPHKALLSRLRRVNKSLSRKQGAKKGEKKSKNFRKAKMKLSKLHARIANIRNDETHKLTTMLAEKYGTIGIEDLNVSGMSKNHRLARAVLDMSFFEFRRQIEYKSKMKGGHVVIADRFYPSSKTCSNCGNKYAELNLSMRDWTCPNCTISHDRDINAAINLKNYAVSYTVSACGELVETVTSMKRELNITNQV